MSANWFDVAWFKTSDDIQTTRLVSPLRWRNPRRVRVSARRNSLFYGSVHDRALSEVFGIMAMCPQHTFVLQIGPTSVHRAENWIRGTPTRCWDHDRHEYILPIDHASRVLAELRVKNAIQPTREWPLPNVHLLVRVSSQHDLDDAIGPLMRTPAAVRALLVDVSHEPITLPIIHVFGDAPAWTGPRIDWIIARAERAHAPDRLRSIVRQCAETRTPIFLDRAQLPPPGEPTGLATGAGSDVRPDRVVDLPYLDGVQHLGLPTPADPTLPTPPS